MIARIESSTARRICASLTPAPVVSAFAAIFVPAAFASAGSGHSPVSAAVRSSAGCGGQSARDQDGPAASACAAPASSSIASKNRAQASSTAPGSEA